MTSDSQRFKCKMQTFVLVALTVLSIPILAFGQSQFGYRPMARGGNFVSNGRYQNQAPQTQYNPYQVPAVNHNGNQRSSNSVIGNTAVNTFGGGAVNSIVGSRFSDSGLSVNSVINPSSGSSNSVIGNTAYNTHGGGQRSSYGGNP